MGKSVIACRVFDITDPCPNLRRSTLHSPDLIGAQLSGPDEYFGPLMPPTDVAFTPFDCVATNIRAAVQALPNETRPNLRWYTVRTLDASNGLLTFDVVLHNYVSGPGSTWISGAQVGDSCGICLAQSLWQPTTAPQILVADTTGTPALLSILDQLPSDALADCSVAVCAPSKSDIELPALPHYSPRLRHLSVKYSATSTAPQTIPDVLRQ
ncbi:siderophore-interacting protein [Corynebacterium epidermidicanis]|uniref:Siderophore-interacting protein n=1 Tax=Corynebacterium epidermidicanis TaxID=1050174 RepID=A0A0G3GW66_9CORY|nr:siderophore-interacting protein [Corynebacterium epidermidicanis]AKK03753.1 siderophore-interacting protein [Corynebacterium epidermidicanis]